MAAKEDKQAKKDRDLLTQFGNGDFIEDKVALKQALRRAGINTAGLED